MLISIENLIYLSIIFFFSTLFLLRKSYFDGLNSDQHKQLEAVKKMKFFEWPSRMHLYGQGKCGMKDVGVFLVKYLSFFYYFKPFKKNKFLIFILQACLAHFMCGFLIYKISILFFNIETSSFIFLIYIFSFWPYMMIVHGGYHHLSNTLILISIYFLLNQSLVNDTFFINFFISGFFFFLGIFASASSRKLLIIYLAVFFYSINLRNFFDFKEYIIFINFELKIIILGILVFCFAIIYFVTISNLEKISLFFYKNVWRKKNNKKKIEEISFKMINIFKLLNKIFLIFLLFIYVLSLFLTSEIQIYYLQLISFLCGFLIISIIFLGPNYIYNLRYFYDYWNIVNKNISNTKNSNDEEVINHSMPKWYFYFSNLYLRIFFIILLVLFLTDLYQNGYGDMPIFITILFFCLSPIVFGELTYGPKVASTIFMAFIPFIFLLGFLINNVIISADILTLIITIYAFFNIYIFYSETVNKTNYVFQIENFLKKNNINLLFVLNSNHNKFIIDLNKHTSKVKIIKLSLNNLKKKNKGWLFLPPISSVSYYHNGTEKIDKNIEKLTFFHIKKGIFRSFKTRANSKYWICFSETNSIKFLSLRKKINFNNGSIYLVPLN